jgi:hypothetical protein
MSEYSDRSFYNNAWNRIRDIRDPGAGFGVGRHEARHWHRRVYGGLVSKHITIGLWILMIFVDQHQ